MGNIHCQVTSENLDVYKLMRKQEKLSGGALLWFVGQVRNHNEGHAVTGISYEASVVHAVQVLENICQEVQAFWGKELDLFVVHRTGDLQVGEWSVLIGVSSPHREEAYLGSRYVIEQIKLRVPIWKREHYASRDSKWLKGSSLNAP